MGTPHLTTPYVNRRSQNLLRRQIMYEPAYRYHIGDRVQSAHLMEMDFLNWTPVGMTFRLGD